MITRLDVRNLLLETPANKCAKLKESLLVWQCPSTTLSFDFASLRIEDLYLARLLSSALDDPAFFCKISLCHGETELE